MLSNHYYQNVVSLTLSGEKDTGSAGKQPASDNLTDWNGQGGQKSPYNYFTIPRNYGLENPTTNRSKKKEKTTIVKLKKGQHISGQDILPKQITSSANVWE